VRAVLALLVVGLAAAPATANPRSREDALSRTPAARELREARPMATPPAMREPGRRSSLAKGLPLRRAPVKADRHERTMPTLWNNVRDKISEQMPHGGNDRAFSYTLTPMVINGAADSAPGLGLSGSF
jgi:hypothetical protein